MRPVISTYARDDDASPPTCSRPLEELLAEARRLRPGEPRHVLAEGLHPADDALPRRLRLLHVRPTAAPWRARVPVRGGGARDRARRRRRGLPRGALHARGQARAPLPGRARGARSLGCETTLEYLARCAQLVLEKTGLLPHLNPGVMTRASSSRCAPFRRRWGSCSRRRRSGSASAAGRTGRRRTSCPRAAWRRSDSRASSGSRSRAASSSGSARRARSGSRPSSR